MAEDSSTSIIHETIATGAGDDIGTAQSALRDNISKKGKNAYYYAHAHKATGPEVGQSPLILLISMLL